MNSKQVPLQLKFCLAGWRKYYVIFECENFQLERYAYMYVFIRK